MRWNERGWLLKFPKIISTYRTKIALDTKCQWSGVIWKISWGKLGFDSGSLHETGIQSNAMNLGTKHVL